MCAVCSEAGISTTASTSESSTRTVIGTMLSPTIGAALSIASTRQKGHQSALNITTSWLKGSTSMFDSSADQRRGPLENRDAEVHKVADHPAPGQADHQQRDQQLGQKAQGLFVDLRGAWNRLTNRPTIRPGRRAR